MKRLLIIALLLVNCKSISGIKALSAGGTTVVDKVMVRSLLSTFVMLQKKDSLKMSPIKIIEIKIEHERIN